MFQRRQTDRDLDEDCRKQDDGKQGERRAFGRVQPGPDPAGGEQELPRREMDRESLSHTLLKAHRALMELNERNEETFRDVVAKLEQITRES